MKTSKSILKIMKREFGRIAERKTLYMLMIILPIVLFFLYALIYKNEIVRELPVAICDNDHSQLSRTLTEFVESTSSMAVVKYVNSVDEIKQAFRRGEIQGAFYIPEDFEKTIKFGKPSTVVIYKNTSNLIIGNLILKDGSAVVKTFSGGVLLKKLRSKGMGVDQAMNIVNPVKLETQSLYNPNYSYESYLVPGLLAVTLQMLIMISSVIVISSEFTHNTFKELIDLADGDVYVMLAGKALPHIVVNIATALLAVGIVFPLFDIRVYGSMILIIAFFIYFIAACLMPGLLISSLFHDQLFATELAVFINTPAFIFSGFTFPLWGMPFAHTVFAQIMPFTHFLSGFLKIYQMNTPLYNLLPEIIKLGIFIIVPALLTIIVLKRRIKEYSTGNNLKTAEAVS